MSNFAGGLEKYGIILSQSSKRTKQKGNDMREFWISVGAMVLGYFMYLGLKAIINKGKED